MYSWEATESQRRSVKKTGTVVLHPQEEVDGSFEKLLREVVLEGDRSAGERRKSALMSPATATALRQVCGFASLLPTQAQCYRGIFRGRDVILHSRTGTGKTLAYALPIIERHLLLELSEKQRVQGPFLLIFVFSNELAHQTKSVLAKVYDKLRFGVASIDDVVGEVYDVVIGTVTALDRVIRGERGSRSEGKRSRTAAEGTSEEGEDDDLSESSDGESGLDAADEQTLLCVRGVRAIVVDEVDTTLGPRFSAVGRCMRNLLRVVRRANGSLSETLLHDFRGHHYVLCGATIPNWVLRATFLGDKKYYYQLIPAGGEKLPPQLRVFSVPCTATTRVATAAHVLRSGTLGRVVVFGTKKQLEALHALLTPPLVKTTETRSAVHLRASCLVQGQGYLDNIRVIDDFNCGVSDVVLCTDVAARGLDFVAVDTVLMVSFPHSNLAAETFIHRSGRTARVGRPGQCVVLYDPKTDASTLEALAKQAHVTFHKSTVFEKSPLATFVLKVASAFSSTAAGVPSPESVLKTALGSEFEKLVDVSTLSSVSVQFSLPVEEAHVVQKKLWKYDVTEV